MGYDKGAVRRLYGPGLDAPARDPLTFNARFNARLGRGPLWVAIRPQALPAPPAPDKPAATPDSFGLRARARKSVGEGKSVSVRVALGVRRHLQQKKSTRK